MSPRYLKERHANYGLWNLWNKIPREVADLENARQALGRHGLVGMILP